MDWLPTKTRSRIMASIRSRDTKPERLVRSCLFRAGLRFRLHRKDLPGKPDIVFVRAKLAVWVHGCFWHCHKNCRSGEPPASNLAYWQPKLKRNVERDIKNRRTLARRGWSHVVIWECDLDKPRLLDKKIDKIIKHVRGAAVASKPKRLRT